MVANAGLDAADTKVFFQVAQGGRGGRRRAYVEAGGSLLAGSRWTVT